MRVQNSRRRFLQTTTAGSLVLGIDRVAPRCLLQAAESLESNQENILVVVQLSGGNDGLNTIVPYEDDAYYKARPELAIPESSVIKQENGIGFHPALTGVADLFEQGSFSVVHGVGYKNPNRSHFESMDIWHSCQRKTQARSSGWLGRFLDAAKGDTAGGDVPGLHLGDRQQPLALASTGVRVPTIRSIDEFRLRVDQDLSKLVNDLAQPAENPALSNDLLSFVQSNTQSALQASQRVAEARQAFKTDVKYPDSRLAERLSVVAQLIDAELTTRIYYVELDGFDTHAQQAEAHTSLLREWSDAVAAFMSDMGNKGHADRIAVMTFSEFGRRVAENASAGTDHGAAAPLFLTSPALKNPVVGSQPALTDLDDGDLKYDIDFREVYATVLNDWLGADPDHILGGQYSQLPLF